MNRTTGVPWHQQLIRERDDRIAELEQELAAQTYRGNSVSWWYEKCKARGAGINKLRAENQRLREALEAAPEPGTGIFGSMRYGRTNDLIESLPYDRYAKWYDGIRLAALEGK